ncbi:hypothetical protein [Sporosarcina aquimarina]|uniref:Bacterial OB-fold domain-containing protein n=1 Tax=Sporosarcina aquimarina TaxID=114975 RepID=A0ABU4FUQ6_9BACL|nr:hypothetical protein [Sporosarcina aquimarina]MDW0108454.1 hypothetical protein [Sporosarcina aquimarina]
MKKIFILLLAGLTLAACSDASKSENTSDSDKSSSVSESAKSDSANDQVSLEEGLKEDSAEVDYEAIATGDVPANKKVKFTGTVFAIEEGQYGLKSDVKDSDEEVLWVDDLRLGERTEIPEGTLVTVYGSYTDMDEQNIPIMKAVFIDIKK